jgi:hypothetical protein
MYSRFTTNYMLNSDINNNNNISFKKDIENEINSLDVKIDELTNDIIQNENFDNKINELINVIIQIQNKKEELKKKLSKNSIYALENNIKNKLFDEFEEYMSKEKVVFNRPSQFENLYGLDTIGMPIKYFSYPLTIIGLSNSTTYYESDCNMLKHSINCDNVYISDIPKPTNHIEELVYSYVKNLIEPHLPIKINQERYSDEGDRDWWILKPSKNHLNIYILIEKGNISVKVRGWCYTNDIYV